MSQMLRYEQFRELHERPEAFIMPNAWDGASALLLKRAGFAALGSSSLAIAFSLGRHDGRRAVTREIAIANAQLLGRLSELPINGDLEDGFGPGPEDCVVTVNAAIGAGLAGLGIEDTTADPANPIHGFDTAVARIKAAAKAAHGRIVLTARTDNYLQGRPDLDDTVRRLTAFAEVGADVLYAPGLPDMESLKTVIKAVAPRAVNVVVGPSNGPVSLTTLDNLGVRRVSLGAALYRRTMATLVDAASALLRGDIAHAVGGATSSSEIDALIPNAQ